MEMGWSSEGQQTEGRAFRPTAPATGGAKPRYRELPDNALES